jgi:hypothetical protein
MSLEHPPALLALLLLPPLLWLSMARRSARETAWPSLLLWRQVASTLPPRKRALEKILLLECAALLLLSLAAASPLLRSGAMRRDVALLIDETASPETLAEAARLRAALAPGDRLREFRAGRDLAEAAARLPEAGLRVVATSRAGIGGAGLTVIGFARKGRNLGIDAVEVRRDQVWFAVATDGPPEEVSVNGRRVRTGEGVTIPFVPLLEIETPDNHDGDDRIELEKIRLGVRPTGFPLADGALLRAGLPAAEGEDLAISVEGGDPVAEEIRGADCRARDGLFLEECAWRGARARPGGGWIEWRDRALVAWLDARTLWIGLPLDREWDDRGTLAVLLEQAKRERAGALAGGRALVGDAYARPAPGALDTRGVDRPWDGRLPEPRAPGDGVKLRPWLAALAAALLLVYLRAIVRAP